MPNPHVDVGIQSPIPLIYLQRLVSVLPSGWDSVTYPLDILGEGQQDHSDLLGFSHLSP